MRRGITFKGLVGAFTVSIMTFVPLGMMAAGYRPPWLPPAAPPLPPLAIIRGMSQLVTTEVHISTFLEGGNNHWTGKWLLHGLVHLGIDLSLVEYAQVDPAKRQAVLRLPNPTLIMSKLEHDRCEELYLKANAVFPVSSQQLVRAEVWKAADKKIERLGREEPGYTERAKVQAERVLETLFKKAGWAVTFEWEDVNGKAKDGLKTQSNSSLAAQSGLPDENAVAAADSRR